MPGGKKCAFISCTSTKTCNSPLRFFKFPVNNPNVCDVWVVNCANEHLIGLSKSALCSRVVCERHFEQSCFNTPSGKSKLRKDAVPTLFLLDSEEQERSLNPENISKTTAASCILDPDDPQPPLTWLQQQRAISVQPGTSHTPPALLTRLPSTQQHQRPMPTLPPPPSTPITKKLMVTAESETSLSTPTAYSAAIRKSFSGKHLSPDTPRKIKLRKRLFKHKKTLRKKAEQARREKIKKLSRERVYAAASEYIQSDAFKTLLRMQMLHKKGTQWSESEKQLSIELHYRSPVLYANLISDKQFHLPSRRTISSWLSIIDLMPGISKDLLDRIKFKSRTMNEQERQTVLMFDEISIKKHLSFNEKRDVIEGFEDLGSHGRSPRIASHVLMFLVRGILHKWKMPIAYFLSGSATEGKILSEIIREVLTSISNAGLQVRVVVCDQGNNNVKAINLLNVTREAPFFHHQEKKVFVVFDTPHLIKCVRNNLMILYSKREKLLGNTSSLCTILMFRHLKPGLYANYLQGTLHQTLLIR